MLTKKHVDYQLQAARQLVEAGSQALRQNNIVGANEAMLEANAILDMAEDNDQDALQLRARVLNELGVIYQRQNQLEKARTFHENAAVICEELMASGLEFRGNTAATHLNLSSILVSLEEYDKALEVGNKAIALTTELREEGELGAEPLALGAYQNMSLIHARLDDLDAADEVMHHAVDLANRLNEQGVPNVSVQAAQGCQQLSVAMFRSELLDRALSWGKIAADLSEKAYEVHGQPVLGVYIVSQINLISYNDELGEFADAEDGLWKAVEVAGNDPQILRRGLEFYEKLRKQSDARLEAGNLPRDEVNEGYAEILERIESIGGLPPVEEADGAEQA